MGAIQNGSLCCYLGRVGGPLNSCCSSSAYYPAWDFGNAAAQAAEVYGFWEQQEDTVSPNPSLLFVMSFLKRGSCFVLLFNVHLALLKGAGLTGLETKSPALIHGSTYRRDRTMKDCPILADLHASVLTWGGYS